MLRNSIMQRTGKSGRCAWPLPQLLQCGPTAIRVLRLPRSTAPGKRKAVNSKSRHWVNSVFRSNFRKFTNTKRRRVQPLNEGEGSGVATIEGDTAIFKPEDAEEECQIALRFTGGKLAVTQTGICGFGHNVSAAGTYKKVSARKPNLVSD
jgi:hypothetical protein